MLVFFLFPGTTCETFKVARKTKDMFIFGRYPIIDCLFDCLYSDSYGGGVSIENTGCWVQMSRCEFLRCIAKGVKQSSARANDGAICSGGGAYLDIGTMDVSYCSFDGCTGTFLGCGLYSAVVSTSTMRYVMCKSCKSLTANVNDISIDSGGQQYNCIASAKYVNSSDSYALSVCGTINFGCHLKCIEMRFINVHMSIAKARVGFVLSALNKVDIQISDISLINGDFESQYGCFYVWMCNVILSKFYSSNSKGHLFKNSDIAQMTVKDSYVSSMDLTGCLTANAIIYKDYVVEYLTKFNFLADFVTCKIRNRNYLFIHMLAVIANT